VFGKNRKENINIEVKMQIRSCQTWRYIYLPLGFKGLSTEVPDLAKFERRKKKKEGII